jgi:hypothetical protein
MRVHFITDAMLGKMAEDLDLQILEMDTRNFRIAVFRK